jgi:hypothetical protein
MDINTFIDKIFASAYNDCKNCAKKLATGEILVSTINSFKEKLGKDFKKELRTLMNHENLTDADIHDKLRQIDHFDQLQNLRQIAESLRIIKDDNNLEGDFKDLDKIDEAVGLYKLPFD